MFFSNNISKLLSHYVVFSLFYWTPFPSCFFQAFLLINSISLSFDLIEPCKVLNLLRVCNIILKLKTIHWRTHHSKIKKTVPTTAIYSKRRHSIKQIYIKLIRMGSGQRSNKNGWYNSDAHHQQGLRTWIWSWAGRESYVQMIIINFTRWIPGADDHH